MPPAVPAPPAELASVAQDLASTPDNLWALGGEVISRLQMDSRLRRQPIEQVILELVSGDGGPLLSHGQSEAGQRSFDATCRKLYRFLTDPAISHDRAPSPPAVTNRPRH
jgi:hypothetical protein